MARRARRRGGLRAPQTRNEFVWESRRSRLRTPRSVNTLRGIAANGRNAIAVADCMPAMILLPAFPSALDRARAPLPGHVSCETTNREAIPNHRHLVAHIMSDSPGSGRTPVEPESRRRAGLRARLWIGALGGAVVASSGLAWVILSPGRDGSPSDPAVELRLGIVALISLVVAVWLAWWLDRGIVARVRRMSNSIRANDASPLHDPHAGTGWGELADLGNQVSALITRYRQTARAADQLQIAERQLDSTRQTILHWIETERWAALPPGVGGLQALSEALNRGFQRQAEVHEQNQEAARQVMGELAAATTDARETAEQAERGFVEATSLLTTVRELERLGGELHQTLGARAATERDMMAAREWAQPVSDAIRELVEAASSSVDDLATSLEGVQDISNQAQMLGNRATMIALNAVLASRRTEGDPAPAEDLKPLARDARAATDRAQVLARDVQVRVTAAQSRMQGVRERVAERLARLDLPRAPETAPGPDMLRALDRVREMVTDAARKAERLSAAGERSSRAADRLLRRLEDEVRDMEGLVVRLSPPPGGELGHGSRWENPELPRLDVIDLGVARTTDEPELDSHHGTSEERS